MADQPESKAPEPPGGAEFVSHIVKDPAHVPDVMRLYGYLGASSEKAHERLYLTPDLSFYVEVPTAAVLYRMPVPPDQDPYGASMLWVRQDALLKYEATPAGDALAHYFAGALQAAAGPPQFQANQNTGRCPTPAVRCQTRPGYFNTGIVVCPTPNNFLCPQTPVVASYVICYSYAFECLTPYFPPRLAVTQLACPAASVVVCYSNLCDTIIDCNTGQNFACPTPRC